MTQQYAPALFDRLMDEAPQAASAWSLEQLKDAVARDLEALFNTRAALPDDMLQPYGEAGASVLNYGLIDFAAMCLSSDEDKKRICAALRLAVERHEPRLRAIGAELRVRPGVVNRVEFLIHAQLRADAAGATVQFDAVLKPSTQQYAIRKAGAAQSGEV